MTEHNASFAFSFSDGTLRIEGSELFVSQQVQTFKEQILDALTSASQMPIKIKELPIPVVGEGQEPVPEPDDRRQTATEGNLFPKVLDEMNGKLKVTASIKGKNKSEKAINLILAYLWGKDKLLGEPTASYGELRDLCEEHACLDSSNFSSTLNSKKHLILVDGVKGSSAKICKLTYPGRDEAMEVLKMLSGD